jgi:hypothetical protein
MPIENIIILGLIVAAFVLFGGVLAYVERIAGRRPDAHSTE